MTLKQYRPYLIIAIIMFLVMLSGAFSDQSPEQIRGIVFGSLIAIVILLTMPIYGIDKWSLTRQTIVHFLIMLVTILPLVMFSGWYDWTNPVGFMIMIGVFLLSGAVIWTIGYTVSMLIMKRSVKKQQ